MFIGFRQFGAIRAERACLTGRLIDRAGEDDLDAGVVRPDPSGEGEAIAFGAATDIGEDQVDRWAARR